MGVMVEGVGAGAAGRIANPMEGMGGAGRGSPILSEVAQSALSGIERFQSGFGSDVTPAVQPQADMAAMRDAGAGGAADPNQAAADQARMLVEQMQQTTKVQQQLVQFVTASSISSSLGRNLNTFLKGQ